MFSARGPHILAVATQGLRDEGQASQRVPGLSTHGELHDVDAVDLIDTNGSAGMFTGLWHVAWVQFWVQFSDPAPDS